MFDNSLKGRNGGIYVFGDADLFFGTRSDAESRAERVE